MFMVAVEGVDTVDEEPDEVLISSFIANPATVPNPDEAELELKFELEFELEFELLLAGVSASKLLKVAFFLEAAGRFLAVGRVT